MRHDGTIPRSANLAIESSDHSATDVRDIGMGLYPDSSIAAHALSKGMAILQFGRVPFGPA